MTISGWAKGVEYRPGAPITSGPINHSWNAVCIDGNWQLVDSHWATRYLQSEKNTPDNLVYEYDDFYFLPEPGNLVYRYSQIVFKQKKLANWDFFHKIDFTLKMCIVMAAYNICTVTFPVSYVMISENICGRCLQNITYY